MLLDHNNIVIFSHPRSGTKLLAKIFEDFGYHRYGEWYALSSTEIKNNEAIRREHHLEEIWSASEKQFRKLEEHIRRYSLYKKIDKSVITIWPESLLEFPFMLQEYQNYHWVCLRRNPWDQILSYYITSINNNFDGLSKSHPVSFKEDLFRKNYWDYYKICGLQDWLVKNKSATLIMFEDLISGNTKEFGKSYNVGTEDQHTGLEELVVNINEVKKWYDKFEKMRLSFPLWNERTDFI